MKDLERYQALVIEVCEEHDCLNEEQRYALGTLLCEMSEKRSADYMAVVNYLWNADEIDLATRYDLLDLA